MPLVTLSVALPGIKIAASILGTSVSELVVGGTIVVACLGIIYKIADAIGVGVRKTDPGEYEIGGQDWVNIPISG